MQVHFHGAAGVVTGSMHLVTTASGQRILLDCGLLQGGRELEARNAEDFPFDPKALDALVLSHAHIDHIGRVPLLVKRGFNGPIYTHAASAELFPVMLDDAASLQESDAKRANKHRDDDEPLQPLFDHDDVRAAEKLLQPLAYERPLEILPGVQLLLRDAGHILGSATVELRADGKTLVFSGDLGQKDTPLLRDPQPVPCADLLLMESTYGDRNHKPREATVHELGKILDDAWNDKGNVLIPAFAVGRTQELLYWFAKFRDEWKMARWRIFLDSPMAAKVVEVYDRQHAILDGDAQALWKGTPNPFQLPNLRVSASVEDSMAINRIENGAIIVAGSGMANGGRIQHHLKYNLERRRAHVVFVGYQSQGTLGRRLVDGASWVRIHGHDYRVNAQVHTIGGLSAHADQSGLIEWYGGFDPHPPLALVHGEDKAREALAGEIGARFGVHAALARPGMVLPV